MSGGDGGVEEVCCLVGNFESVSFVTLVLRGEHRQMPPVGI